MYTYVLLTCLGILAITVLYKAGEVLYMKRKLEDKEKQIELRERQIDGLRLTIEAYKELSALDKLIPKGEKL